MLNNKILIIILLALIVLVTSACVVSDEDVTKSNSNEGTFEQLASLVSGSDKSGEIILTKNYVNTDNYDENGINISASNVVIKAEQGKDITIDANNAGRIFNANGTRNVTFENIKFINANATGAGGAVVLGKEDNNKVVNCSFENCSSSEFGGALDGTAYNCSFKNCSTVYHGGAIFEGSAMGCVFEECYSTSCGGAISYNSATNCNFTNCYAYWQGGALYQADAINSKFVNCNASEGGSMYEGSAFGCFFEHSTATNGSGGGIYQGTAIESKFTACSVNGGEGSAMYGTNAINCDCPSDEAVNTHNDGNSGRYKFEDTYLSHIRMALFQ
ncbi:hypothetical protein [Methanosphaera sp. BMS]|uniref:hypothetical protein n=1 Tax=Methanosphaera sp. BMS TaxID=1789762 RepID=UPI000DC1EE32|nr:hypothetical protein [Methanosphaera sp. BMS]AWX31696.1 hypothetical protein AW729_00715 [Methanosphaera sp. BMS]